MADTRTLKLSLLADVNKFISGMDQADKGTKNLNNKIGGYSKKMALAFAAVTAAAGAMAIKIGVDAVKAAAEDEASQAKFQKTLKNTAGVVNKTVIKSIDEWITRMQFAKGYSDGDLRDSLGRLTRSTHDVQKAQDILNVAMDVARGTSKPLSDVTNMLAKAYDGNYAPLKKLGIKLDENIIKSKDFTGATDALSQMFGGQASTYTDTYAGKIELLKQRFGELQESLGAKFLDGLKKAADVALEVYKGFAGEKTGSLLVGIRAAHDETGRKDSSGYTLGEALHTLANAMGDMVSAFSSDSTVKASDNLKTLADAINVLASAIRNIAGAYKFAKGIIGKLTDTIIMGEGKAGYASGLPGLSFGAKGSGKNGQRAYGGPVSRGNSYLVGERGPEMFTPNTGGNITRNGGSGGGVVINLNGIVDAESARRTIEQLIQRSARRTGAIDWVGATL